jgi:hypothetical protein
LRSSNDGVEPKGKHRSDRSRKLQEASKMLRIAVPVLALLAVGYAATAWSHGFKADGASKTEAFVSERVVARIPPIPLQHLRI